MKAADVIEALRGLHSPSRGWVTVSEVRVGTGWSDGRTDMPDEIRGAREQRIDFYAMQTWPSKGYERVAYEVKVSRSDLLAELRNPQKRAAAEYLSHRFLFACPAGLMKRSEVPEGCGLVEIRADGTTYTWRTGDRRDAPDLPMPFVASLLRNAADQKAVGGPCSIATCGRRGRWHWWTGGRPYQGLRLSVCDLHHDELADREIPA